MLTRIRTWTRGRRARLAKLAHDRGQSALSTALEAAGLVALARAAWMVAPALGLAVAGLGLVLAGSTLDPSGRRRPRP